YRVKTGIKRRPLRCIGTLLPRNLCKRQKQNVALQWRTARDGPSDLRPLTLATTGLQSCYELENALAKRIVLVAGNSVTSSRRIDICCNVRSEATVCTCIYSFIRHTAWVVVRISRAE